MNFEGSSHPPPADDDSKPLKKRKKPNQMLQTGEMPATGAAGAEVTMLPMSTPPNPPQPQLQQPRADEDQQKSQQQQRQHQHLVPESTLNNLAHVPMSAPPPLEVQRPIEELRMKKNFHKSPLAGSSKICSKSQKPTRRRWTPAEDDALRKLVVSYGNSWASIAQHMPSRSQRTCRARWHYVLDPSIKRTQWTEEEEQIIVTYHNQYGNKWSKIAKHLEGRSAEAIRNHWNCRRTALLAKWKGPVVTKMVNAKTNNSAKTSDGAPADWQQAQGNGIAPPVTQEPFYNKKTTDVAGVETTPKLADDAKPTPAQPPALYPSSEAATDRDNWSRVSRGRVFSADACADIGAMPSAVRSSNVCVESQSLILPFSYKPSGASL